MPGNQTHIALPRERFRQLKSVSAALGNASMSRTVGELMALAAMNGIITRDFPGVVVKSAADGILVQFGDERAHAIPNTAVAPLAETIREFATGAHEAAECFDMDAMVIVRKRGPAVQIILGGIGGATKTWPCDLALEFADLLESALAKAA